MSSVSTPAPAFRVDAFDSFLQVFSNVAFRVIDFRADEPRSSKPVKKKRASSSHDSGEDDNDDEAPEQPLAHPLSSSEDVDSGLQRVSLVSLRADRTFHIQVEHNQPHSSGEADSPMVVALLLKGRTTNNCRIVNPRMLITGDHLLRLSDSEFIRTLVLHPSDWMLSLVDWRRKREVLALLSRCYYEGLFTISTRHDCLLSIPNGNPRYGIDFTKCKPGCWTHSRKVRRLLRCCGEEVGDGPLLRVVVNRNFGDSMKRAAEYHTARGGTWITSDLIKAMELMSAVGSAHGVRLCAVELWDVKANELLAGCLGFALGSVYHDFTMFTCVRSTNSYGSLITKLLAAALQDCGYRLWYWGFRVEYMHSFEERCGACHWDRDVFYDLWTTHRSELPVWHVAEYLNDGRGLVAPLSRENLSV